MDAATDPAPAVWTQPATLEASATAGDRSGKIVWAVGHDGLVAASQDAGETWRRVRLPATTQDLLAVVCDERCQNIWIAGRQQKLLRSQDAGRNWEALDARTGQQSFDELIYHEPSHALVAVAGDKLMRSLDGGSSWQLIPMDGSVYGLAVDAATGEFWAAGEQGVHRGRANDDRWQAVDIGTKQSVLRVAIDPQTQHVWLGDARGIVRYFDGMQWHILPESEPRGRIHRMATDGETLWVLKAIDGGQFALQSWSGHRWRSLQSGIELRRGELHVRGSTALLFTGNGELSRISRDAVKVQSPALAKLITDDSTLGGVAEKGGTRAWIVTRDGAAVTHDEGLTWHQMPLPANSEYPSLARDDVADQLWIELGGQLWTRIGARPWQHVGRVSGGDLSFDPTTNKLFLRSTLQLYVSADRGASWQLLHEFPSFITSFAVDPATRTLWVGTRWRGLYEGSEFGASWREVSLPTPLSSVLSIDSILIRTEGPYRTLVVAGTDRVAPQPTVYRRSRSGDWHATPVVSERELDSHGDLIAAGNSGPVLLSSMFQKLISYDNGSTWRALNWPLNDSVKHEWVALDDGRGAPLLVGMGSTRVDDAEDINEPYARRVLVRERGFPVLTGMALPTFKAAAPNVMRLRFAEGNICSVANMKLQLEFRPAGGAAFEPLSGDFELLKDGVTVEASFSLAERHLQTGNMFDLLVRTECEQSPPFSRVYSFDQQRIGHWIESVPGGQQTLWIIAAALLSPALVLLLYVFAPGGVLWLQTSRLAALADNLPNSWSWIPRLLLGYLLMPWLARKPRVLDAWVTRHVTAFREAFENASVVKARDEVFVPLALMATREGERLDGLQPSPAALDPLFSDGRMRSVISGAGGAGKTRLAIEIGRWCMAGEFSHLLGGFRRVTILIDEPVKDIELTLRQKLKAVLGEELNEDLRDALLRAGRLLVIAERFSEHDQATQQQILRLPLEFGATALIVTTRTPVDLQVAGQVNLAVQPLNAATLILLIGSLLRAQVEIPPVIATVMDMFVLVIASKLTYAENEVAQQDSGYRAITPLFVKLFVDSVNDPGDPNSVPDVIVPEVYFRYVERLDNGSGAAALDLRRACVALGRLALSTDLRPTEFTSESASAALTKAGISIETIDRLIKHGVLRDRMLGRQRELRFELDPIAENFGLYAQAVDCGSDSNAWRNLLARIGAQGELAEGLLAALVAIHAAYAKTERWPSLTSAEFEP